MIDEWIDGRYLNEEKQSDMHWKFTDAVPYKHIFLNDMLNKKKADELSKALMNEDFHEKDADLFQFKQTDDLEASSSNTINEFYEFLNSMQFAEFIRMLTGKNVKAGSSDVSGTLYTKTDYLLCHDDQVEDRKLAYIFYLGDDFEEKDGGSFNLIKSNSGKPGEVARKIFPKFNSFMIFEVSKKSFHEVEEVISNKKRYAIGGWMH